MHLYFRKVRKKRKKIKHGGGFSLAQWDSSAAAHTSRLDAELIGSCSPATELLAGREERLTRRGAPHQPRGAARRCSPPGGPAHRRVELQSQIEPINLVTAHTELVQVYSVNFPTLLQSFGHFSMNLV